MTRVILTQFALAIFIAGCIQEYSQDKPQCPCEEGWRCCLDETAVDACVPDGRSCPCLGLVGEMELSDDHMPADGNSMSEVVVRVFDMCGGKRPQTNITVIVHSSRNQGDSELDFFEQPTGPTDTDGMAVAYIGSSVPGEATLSGSADGESLCNTWEGTECIDPVETIITFVQ